MEDPNTVQTPELINDGLLDSIVEQLRSPLLTIQLMLEAGQTEGLEAITGSSLQLLDDIHYVRELSRVQPKLDLSPVNISALSEDIAHRLDPFAKSRSVIIQTKTISHRPVLSHYFTLFRAYENMVRGIMEMSKQEKETTIVLSSNITGDQVRLGSYSSTAELAARDLHRMRKLFGSTRRPLGQITSSPVAELYVADNLLMLLGTRMRTAISSHNHGVATFLTSSRQLSFIS